MVETIICDKLDKGVRKYRVKWLGYSHAESTWETAETLANNSVFIEYIKGKRGKRAKTGKSATKQQKT